jgi:mRNA-degrading endonuclease YafQ of YafQ-DinJ toxin-antitoxin module
MPNVTFRTCKLFDKTFDSYKQNKKVVSAFVAFKNAKMADPTAKYGSKDYKFLNGPLSKYWHAGLSFDVSIVYTTERKGNDFVINLYCVCSHDESGTGQPPNNKKQQSLATRLDNQVFT